jgi:hypothetical protein
MVAISSIKHGVLLDLSLLNDVTSSKDRFRVSIGAGSLWRDVYKVIENKDLGVVGGWSSPVGVGGSTLQR